MGQTRGIYVSIILIMLMAPLVSISDDSRQRGGLDFNGNWVDSIEPEIHFNGGSTGVETRMVILLMTD